MNKIMSLVAAAAISGCVQGENVDEDQNPSTGVEIVQRALTSYTSPYGGSTAVRMIVGNNPAGAGVPQIGWQRKSDGHCTWAGAIGDANGMFDDVRVTLSLMADHAYVAGAPDRSFTCSNFGGQTFWFSQPDQFNNSTGQWKQITIRGDDGNDVIYGNGYTQTEAGFGNDTIRVQWGPPIGTGVFTRAFGGPGDDSMISSIDCFAHNTGTYNGDDNNDCLQVAQCGNVGQCAGGLSDKKVGFLGNVHSCEIDVASCPAPL